ncbi:MAG: glycoside hydrolase family 31 protein [Aggregatilineales bacterium]
MIEQRSAFFDRIRIEANPYAHLNSIVICGQARFTVLTSRLIRLEWSEAGEFEDRATFAFPGRYAEPPSFHSELKGTQLELRTEALTLRYADTGGPFDESNLSIEFNVSGQRAAWKPGAVNRGNLRGTRRTLDQCYDAASLQEGLLSREGWALFDDSGSAVWGSDRVWVEARPESHVQDWYFFGYGHNYKAALADYAHFGGPIPLIPRYVLGGWWSRFWPYHADDLKQLVKDFESHHIPLDVLVVDMDWHTPDGWTGYTWNRKLFPDPTAFLAWVHTQDLRVTLNLHPADGVQKHEEAYPRFAALLGQDPNSKTGIRFAPTDKVFMEYYFEVLHHPLEEQGVDFWWLDWQQGESSGVKGLDPLPWLNHLHFRDAARRGARPMLYSRWGGLGNHRYPIGFSGDTYATWEVLRFQTYFTPTAANVAYGWWSHDIGGHFGATNPELYARWVQFGAVSPCLRLHATNDPLAERRPWAFPTPIYEAAKAAFQFRYRLLPYLYSAARTASQRGLSLCYPTYYDYPECEDAYLAREQYFLGDQMFVAPITRPADPETGLAAFDVWIPDGTWIEYTTREAFTGPKWVRLQGDLNRIPMFVKAGGIIPMAAPMMRTKDWDGSHLVLEVFPGADGQFTLYEDDGVTNAYKDGGYETTLIRSTASDRQTIGISVGAAEGKCSALPAQRTIEFRLREISLPKRIEINKVECTNWFYDEQARTLIITARNTDRRKPLNVAVEAQAAIATAQLGAPFVHCIDYTLVEDARKQLGTIIVVPPTDGSSFNAEIEWHLEKGERSVSIAPLILENCTEEQIIHSPFADDDLSTFRWGVSVKIVWQGQVSPYTYESQTARPSINHWRTAIYNPEQQPLAAHDLFSKNGNAIPSLDWSLQTANNTLNLKQPFGVILLEHERQRLLTHEALEACLSATFESPSVQDAILYLQCVGTAKCYLNDQELTPIDPISHETLQPMFYTWMPPTPSYYALPLRVGANQLVVVTRPTASTEWWGIGATLLDHAGIVVTEIFSKI